MTSVARRQEHDSGEYSDGSHQDNEQEISGNDGQQESDYESQGSESDHSEKEEESQETERRVDDDEDRSNPQYIPKRGTFYEHDDRTAASGEESANTTSETTSEKKEGGEPTTERRRPPRKSEAINKWSHDKYNENEQMPKSRDELVAIYGYDIRNEDAPPHARRNRRYGRGPNKYTRTWEDGEAYKRQNAAPTPNRKPPSAEDFPELDAKNTRMRRGPRPRSKSQPSSNDSIDSGTPLRRNASVKTSQPKPVVKPSPRPKPKREPRENNKDKLPAIENLTITANVVNNNNNSQAPPQRKVNATVAQQRPVPTEQGKKRPTLTQQPPQPNSGPNKSPPQQQNQQQQKQQTAQQQSQPAQQQGNAAQESRGGSKRYSSLRQRPLDTYSAPNQQQQQPQQPQQNQQQQQPQPQQNNQNQLQQNQHRFHAEFNSGAAPAHQGSAAPQPQILPQHLMQQMRVAGNVSQPQHGPSPPLQQLPQHAQSQVRLIEQQQLVSHHSMHNMQQPHNIGQLQPNQGYAPPAMMPAQYMQQSGSGAVYGSAPLYAQPPAPYPHPQMYPHHNFVSGSHPAPGGVTYYSCAEHEQPPRATRRPTAAIPIVRPQPPDRPANSSEKDNIDRIVENMFVRKPWPAHGADSKDKERNSQEPQSKESSQSDSLTSSSISTDSKPSETIDKKEESQKDPQKEVQEEQDEDRSEQKESIDTEA